VRYLKFRVTITIPSQVSRYLILPQYRKYAFHSENFQCRSEFTTLRLFSTRRLLLSLESLCASVVYTVKCSNYMVLVANNLSASDITNLLYYYVVLIDQRFLIFHDGSVAFILYFVINCSFSKTLQHSAK